MEINYKASNFRNECIVDDEFAKELDKMNTIAIKHNMLIIITSSLRHSTDVKGAIVTPSKVSNHLIGFAIDCNLQSTVTNEYFNSVKMGDKKGIDLLFIEDIEKNTKLRWGGRFKTVDYVHFDIPLNITNPKLWLEKFNSIKKQKPL